MNEATQAAAEAHAKDEAPRESCGLVAHDLMPQYSGPALGQKLRILETQWIDSEFRLTKEALLNGI